MRNFDPATLTSEWATWYVIELAHAYAGLGEPIPAAYHARRALTVAKATGSTRLTHEVQAIHQTLTARWPDEDEITRLTEALASM
ncbi:hypothetical protein ACQEU3_15120 [Spirillospora sp. CA-253888]